MSKRCQVVKKDVKCRKIEYVDYRGGSQKIYKMRFTHTDVSFDVTCDGDQKCPKCA